MYMNTAFDKVCFKGSVVSQSARFVYLCLCKHADNTKQTCFPSLNRIAQIVGKSISTIKRAVRELCRYGAIKRAPRFRKDGGQTSNLYEIVECDFEQLVEIPDNKEDKEAGKIPDTKVHPQFTEKEARNTANWTSQVELQNQDIKKDSIIEDISFSVSDIQTKNSCTVEGNETKEIVENKSNTLPQKQDITTDTSAEDILLTVLDTKALNTCAGKENEAVQKSSTAEQQEDLSHIIEEDESKSIHNKLENNSVNPINGMNENMDEAEQIYIFENAEQEDKKVKQEQIEFRVYPTSQNNNNQIVDAELDDEPLKTNFNSLKVLSSKKSFAKIVKPISYIISACKSRFSSQNELGGGHQ